MRNNKQIDKKCLCTSYQTIRAQDDSIASQKYTRALCHHQVTLSFRQLALPPKKSQNISELMLSQKPLGWHFTLPNHSPNVHHINSHNLAFITKPSNTSAALHMRLKLEQDWIYWLRTNLSHGLNAMDWRWHCYPYHLPYSTFLPHILD